MAGGYFFWFGASADADPATHASHGAANASPPCGGCPLRGAIEQARDELLKIPLEVVEKHLDLAYVAISRAVGDPE